MKKVYLLIASFSVLGALNAQTFQWAKAEGKYAYDYGYGIQTDNDGNVYVAGKYEEDQADFSGTKVGCQGNHDGFLVKYNPSGAVQWVRTVGGVGGDYYEALSTDGSYLYGSGEIENNSTSATVPIYFSNSTTTLTTSYDNDVFLVKYDLSGNLIWAISEGNTNSEKGLGNAVDAQGNVYVCGYFTNTTDFNGTTYTGHGDNRDIYVAKYNSNGEFQWFRQAGGSGRDEAKGAICDAQGNVYITGLYSRNCSFGSTTVDTYNHTDYFDAFLAKYDASGNLQWVKTGGSDWNDVAWGIAKDNSGNIFIGGEFDAYAQFDNLNATTHGGADPFIAKYSPDGTIQWLRSFGGDAHDRIRGIGSDGTNIHATGQFGESMSLGQTTITATDTSDIFITVISSEGTWGHLVKVGGGVDQKEDLGYESGNAIAGRATGEIYATGGLLDGGTFGNIPVTGYTKTDAFVTKLTWSGAVSVSEISGKGNLKLYPNPTADVLNLDFGSLKSDNVNVKVYNCLGTCVSSLDASGKTTTVLDLRGVAPGVYFIEMTADGVKSPAEKIIIER